MTGGSLNIFLLPRFSLPKSHSSSKYSLLSFLAIRLSWWDNNRSKSTSCKYTARTCILQNPLIWPFFDFWVGHVWFTSACNSFNIYVGRCSCTIRSSWKSFKFDSIFNNTVSHRPTESNTVQGYVKPVMDSERVNLELSLLYMERRLNVYSIIWRYLQFLNYLKISLVHLKISSNN